MIKVEKTEYVIAGADYPRLSGPSVIVTPKMWVAFLATPAFLEAMADPKHDEHDRMREWSGGKFDPEEAKIGRILDTSQRRAEQWSDAGRDPWR